MLPILIALLTMSNMSFSCHYTDIEYNWSLGNRPVTKLNTTGSTGTSCEETGTYCGSDGVTYSNVCEAKKKNKAAKGTEGACEGSGCYMYSKEYEYQDESVVLTSTTEDKPSACQDQCKAEDKCEWFVWKYPTECKLLSGKKGSRNLVGSVSGPKQCASVRNDCLEPDTIYKGAPLKKGDGGNNNYGQTETAPECQAMCQRTPGCLWFNWDDKGCWLKTGKGKERENKPGVMTGPRNCKDSECIMEDKEYKGFPLNNDEGKNNNYGLTTDAKTCQLLCQRTAGCLWFNWLKDESKSQNGGDCWLKKRRGKEVEVDEDGKETATGPRSCPTSGCFIKDKAFIGHPLKKLDGSNNDYGPTDDALACQVLCQATPKCGWFNWNGNCFLKTKKGSTSEKKSDSVTGPRSCQCFQIGFIFEGKEANRVEEKSAAKCQDRCISEDNCNWFTFAPPNNCLLMKERESTKPATGEDKDKIISGRKFCQECVEDINAEEFCGEDGITYKSKCEAENRKKLKGFSGKCIDYFEYNTRYTGETAKTREKRQTQDISSPTLCQDLCKLNDECKFFTWQYPSTCEQFKTKDGSVVLAGAVSGPREETSGPNEDPTTEDDCIEKDVVYTGNPLVSDQNAKKDNNYGTKESALACRTLCQATAGCEWFNWDGDCWLKTGKGTRKEDTGKFSGSRTCPQQDCYDIGVTYEPEGKVDRRPNKDATGCKERCEVVDSCNWFSFQPETEITEPVCVIIKDKKKPETEPASGELKNRFIAGPKKCPESGSSADCIEEDVIYAGNALNSDDNTKKDNNYGPTDTAQECQVLCQGTPGCQWFNWDKDCWLKSGKGNKVVDEKHKGKKSGPRSCPCIEKDVYYVGGPLNKPDSNDNNHGPTDTEKACQIKCQETEQCEWFNWDQDKKCSLKTKKGTDKKDREGSMSGPRTCDCLEQDVQYIGNPLIIDGRKNNNYGKTKNARDCQKKCKEIEGCGWFNWDGSDCFLKTARGSGPKKMQGGITGPKNC